MKYDVMFKTIIEKKNIWIMLVLGIVTLGIYFPIYFWELKKATDITETTKKASGALLVAFSVVGVGNAIYIFYILFVENVYSFFMELFFFVAVILEVTLAFQFKDILNEYFNNIQKKRMVFSDRGVFFFSIYYLQHKINKALEKEVATFPLTGDCKKCQTTIGFHEPGPCRCSFCKTILVVDEFGDVHIPKKRTK